MNYLNLSLASLLGLGLASMASATPISLITQPGDPILAVPAASSNEPGEGVAHAIDGNTQKYLNFGIVNTGFLVTPAGGTSVVTSLTVFTGNDAPERDPTSYTLYGSNDAGTTLVPISSGPLALPAGRNGGGQTIPGYGLGNGVGTPFFGQTVSFPNSSAFASYELLFPTVSGSTCCMQIGEAQLGGVFGTPEPASLGLIGVAAAGVLARRRRT